MLVLVILVLIVASIALFIFHSYREGLEHDRKLIIDYERLNKLRLEADEQIKHRRALKRAELLAGNYKEPVRRSRSSTNEALRARRDDGALSNSRQSDNTNDALTAAVMYSAFDSGSSSDSSSSYSDSSSSYDSGGGGSFDGGGASGDY